MFEKDQFPHMGRPKTTITEDEIGRILDLKREGRTIREISLMTHHQTEFITRILKARGEKVRGPLTGDELNEIVASYKDGQTISKLAAKYHVALVTIHKGLRRIIEPTEMKRLVSVHHARSCLPESQWNQICTSFRAGKSLLVLSKTHGLDRSYLARRVKKMIGEEEYKRVLTRRNTWGKGVPLG
jgi:hypothetical protein